MANNNWMYDLKELILVNTEKKLRLTTIVGF